jgi:hypothetical protein
VPDDAVAIRKDGRAQSGTIDPAKTDHQKSRVKATVSKATSKDHEATSYTVFPT